MPSFKVHIAVSATLGVTGAALGMSWQQWGADVSMLAGLCGFAGGMMPDLDSDSGKPVRIAGGLAGLVLSIGLIYFLHRMNTPPLTIALTGAAMLFILNTAGVKAFKTMTRHRGMFHSIPAVLIFGSALAGIFAPLGFRAASGAALVGMAGFVSHLILDGVFSLTLKPFKLWSKDRLASCFAWLLAVSGLTVAYIQFN